MICKKNCLSVYIYEIEINFAFIRIPFYKRAFVIYFFSVSTDYEEKEDKASKQKM
jgi:hypothetical protein